MSTQINVTVDSGGLSERVKQQQLAARQAQLEKERTINLSAEALDKRVAAQAAKGLSLEGQPLNSAGSKQPQIQRRPAANRFGAEETVSMGWLCVGPNDWRTGSNSNQITTIEGTNQGRALAISSTDATYWLQINGIPETSATGDFAPGNPTVYSAPFSTPYFVQRSWNNYTYDVLPLGKGNYMVLLRYEKAYSRVRWNFVSSNPNTYAIDMSPYSGISTHYQAFVVGKSSVRQINTIAQQTKTYLDSKVARAVPVTVGNYYLSVSANSNAIYGVSDWPPDGFPSNFGLAQSFSFQLAANRAGNPNAYPYSGWYVGRMPFATGPVPLGFASPAVYSKYTNYADWTDVTPTATNNFGTNAYDTWFAGLANAVPEDKIKNALGHSRETDSSFYSNTFSLPVYTWQQGNPVGNQWIFGPAGNPPRPSITDPLYWKAFKTLSFSPSALPVPALPSYSTDAGGVSSPQSILLTVTDWGAPSYCRQQALALGFTSADLTP
jgi:hypothetical protein